MSKLKLVMHRHGRGEVFIDGAKIKGARAVQLTVGVDECNVATVTFTPDEIEVEGEFDVTSLDSTSRVFWQGRVTVVIRDFKYSSAHLCMGLPYWAIKAGDVPVTCVDDLKKFTKRQLDRIAESIRAETLGDVNLERLWNKLKTFKEPFKSSTDFLHPRETIAKSPIRPPSTPGYEPKIKW